MDSTISNENFLLEILSNMNIEKYMPVASHPKYVGASFLESLMYKDLDRIKDLFWWLIESKFEKFHGTVFSPESAKRQSPFTSTLSLYHVRSKKIFKCNRTFHLLLSALRLVFLPTETT